jgi:hypothetical protein
MGVVYRIVERFQGVDFACIRGVGYLGSIYLILYRKREGQRRKVKEYRGIGYFTEEYKLGDYKFENFKASRDMISQIEQR